MLTFLKIQMCSGPRPLSVAIGVSLEHLLRAPTLLPRLPVSRQAPPALAETRDAAPAPPRHREGTVTVGRDACRRWS